MTNALFSSLFQTLKKCSKDKLYSQGHSLWYRKCSQVSTSSLSQLEKSEDMLYKEYDNSLKHKDYFGISNLFNVEDLFHAKIHLGHKEGTLNNYMRPYVFGSRLGHLIIDLDQTSSLLRDALNFTAHIAFRGGIVLFIARGAQHQLLIEKTAESCHEYSHTRAWNSGTLTNSTKVFGCVTRLPDLLIFMNTLNDVLTQHEAVADASRMLIPTVGIVDTNCDPRLITYPVPGNDDTKSSVQLYCELFAKAIMLGKNKRNEILFGSKYKNLAKEIMSQNS